MLTPKQLCIVPESPIVNIIPEFSDSDDLNIFSTLQRLFISFETVSYTTLKNR